MTLYYEDGAVTIYHGDALDEMEALAGSVDLVFTSPPYNLGTTTGGGFGHYAANARLGKSRGGGGKWSGGALAEGYADHDDALPMDEYEAWQQACLLGMWHTLTTGGAIFYNHKPRPQGTLWHPRRCIPSHLPVRQEIIWKRAGGINFAPTHYVPTYEVIIIVAKDDWRLKSKGASGAGDVWAVTQESGSDHPCPFPLGLPARAIETAGPSLVLDPFMGSGTTLVAAKAAGVRAIGIEKSERYCEMAVERLAQGSLFAVAPSPLPERGET